MGSQMRMTGCLGEVERSESLVMAVWAVMVVTMLAKAGTTGEMD